MPAFPASRRWPPTPVGCFDWRVRLVDRTCGKAGGHGTRPRIGLDGVQVSFGKPGDAFDLRLRKNRRRYQERRRAHQVEIASLAMGVLNEVPYASDPGRRSGSQDCVEVMPKLGVKSSCWPSFGDGDIQGQARAARRSDPPAEASRPRAEKAGVVLGVESWLNADDHLRILDAVGSPAVQVYYDVANMHKQGYDIYHEIRQLGRERICEIHCKENGCLLGEGRDRLRQRQGSHRRHRLPRLADHRVRLGPRIERCRQLPAQPAVPADGFSHGVGYAKVRAQNSMFWARIFRTPSDAPRAEVAGERVG